MEFCIALQFEIDMNLEIRFINIKEYIWIVILKCHITSELKWHSYQIAFR
jgi:hypothetical protein